MIRNDETDALWRFLNYHRLYEPKPESLNLSRMPTILNELARSKLREAEHPTLKEYMAAMQSVAVWRGDNDSWRQARYRGLVPYIPTLAQLTALVYLSRAHKGLPQEFIDAAENENVELGWYVHGEDKAPW